jgi:hypothetical protein
LAEKFMGEWLNERSWQHSGPNGTEFTADRCDFKSGVTANVPMDMKLERLMQDVSAMVGYHATNILPHLNEFQGYDAFQFTINRT